MRSDFSLNIIIKLKVDGECFDYPLLRGDAERAAACRFCFYFLDWISPEIICDHRGRTRLDAMKRFCLAAYDPTAHLNFLTFSPLTGGCSEGLDAFIFFLKKEEAG